MIRPIRRIKTIRPECLKDNTGSVKGNRIGFNSYSISTYLDIGVKDIILQ